MTVLTVALHVAFLAPVHVIVVSEPDMLSFPLSVPENESSALITNETAPFTVAPAEWEVTEILGFSLSTVALTAAVPVLLRVSDARTYIVSAWLSEYAEELKYPVPEGMLLHVELSREMR